jgi:hypothetical protein
MAKWMEGLDVMLLFMKRLGKNERGSAAQKEEEEAQPITSHIVLRHP